MNTSILNLSYSINIGIYTEYLLPQSILSFFFKSLSRFDDEGVPEERETSSASQPLSKPYRRAPRISSLRQILSPRIDPPGENHQHSNMCFRRKVDGDGDVDGDVDVELAVVKLLVLNLQAPKNRDVVEDGDGEENARGGLHKKQDDQYVDFQGRNQAECTIFSH